MNATWCNHQIVVTLTPDTCCWNLVIKNNLTEDIHHQTSCKPLWKRLVWSLQGSKKKQHCANQSVVSHVPWPKCVLSLLFPIEGSTGHWGSPFSLGTWAGLRLVRVIGVLIWMKDDSIQSLLFWGLLPKHLGLRLVRLILDLYLN